MARTASWLSSSLIAGKQEEVADPCMLPRKIRLPLPGPSCRVFVGAAGTGSQTGSASAALIICGNYGPRKEADKDFLQGEAFLTGTGVFC